MVALCVPGDASGVVGLDVFRVELDCLVQVRDGADKVALGHPGDAATNVTADARTEDDRFRVIRESTVEIALMFVFNGPILVETREIVPPELARRDGASARRDR